MNPRRRRWLAGLCGSGLLLLLLLLVSLDDFYRAEPPETVALREVQIYRPPPPPPPPPTARRNASSAGPPLTLAKSTNQIAFKVMELDVELSAGQFGNFGTGFEGLGERDGLGLDIVSLSELDGIPMVLRAPALVYPEEAVERGLSEFRVMIHILIDEEGRAYPVRIVLNPFPSRQQEFMEYTSKVQFSPPTRLGIPVKTEYIWPLLIKRP